MQSKLVIGIDVSNKELDCAEGTSEMNVHQLRKAPVRKVVNEVGSVSEFLDEYRDQDPLVVFEATGTYSDKLQSLLAEKGMRYSQVNPKQGSHFFNSLGVHIKTDKTSARLLTFMGLRFDLETYSPPSEEMKQRKQLLQALCGLEKSYFLMHLVHHHHCYYFVPVPLQMSQV